MQLGAAKGCRKRVPQASPGAHVLLVVVGACHVMEHVVRVLKAPFLHVGALILADRGRDGVQPVAEVAHVLLRDQVVTRWELRLGAPRGQHLRRLTPVLRAELVEHALRKLLCDDGEVESVAPLAPCLLRLVAQLAGDVRKHGVRGVVMLSLQHA